LRFALTLRRAHGGLAGPGSVGSGSAAGAFQLIDGVTPGPFAVGDVSRQGFEPFHVVAEKINGADALKDLALQLVGFLKTSPSLADGGLEHLEPGIDGGFKGNCGGAHILFPP
jgi:hypothetical protein